MLFRLKKTIDLLHIVSVAALQNPTNFDSSRSAARVCPKSDFPAAESPCLKQQRRGWGGTPAALFRLVNTYSRGRKEGGREGRRGSARFNHRLRLSASLPPQPPLPPLSSRLPPACPPGRGRGPLSALALSLSLSLSLSLARSLAAQPP